MNAWPDVLAACHRAHVRSVGEALDNGQPVGCVAVVGIGADLVPIIGPDWHAVGQGIYALAPMARGYPVAGVAFHGLGVMGLNGQPVAWSWGAPRCSPGWGHADRIAADLDTAPRVVGEVATVADLTRRLWPALIAAEQ